jgi:hypothetical protein
MEINGKGYCDMDELIAFVNQLKTVQKSILCSVLIEQMLDHSGNKYEATDDVRKSLGVMQANWMYDLK